MYHADQHWTEALPLVLLEIRTTFKEDLQASAAELVYGEPLIIPGKLLTLTTDPVDPAESSASPSQTDSGNTPHLPGYICAQRP
jgi:hypothetical protein